MKLVDTTNPSAHAGMQTLIGTAETERECQLASKFRINLIGMYYAEVGAEWNSHGREESNYLHHLEISLSSNRQVIHQGKIHSLQTGDVWYFPGNTPVARTCDETSRVLFFRVSCEWLPGVDPLLDWPKREPRFIGKIEPADWQAWRNPQKQASVSELIRLRSQLLTWIAQAIPELDEVLSYHLASHRQFAAVFEHIENRLGADLRLGELAKIHGLSQAAFSMAFSRCIGISAKEYLTRRLNQQALQWVISSDLRIKEIADKLRFNDEYYFSRFFQKLNGSPPSRYRQTFRGGTA